VDDDQAGQTMHGVYMVLGILVKLDVIWVNKKEVREIVMIKTISIKDEDGGIIHQFIWSM
jgi:hypothetical protein